jgi:acylpyruvate hydrolase
VKLATLRTPGGTVAVRVDGDTATELGAGDVGALLALPDWRERAARAVGPVHALADADYAPVVLAPPAIVCVGLNYAHHIREMGRELPEYPTLFAKFTPALVGAYDDITLPSSSDAVDWEAELAVVIGRRVRHATEEEARDAIAGYAVLNDVTARDWQYRSAQWLQGKTFEGTTPFGPYLVTADEAGEGLDLVCEVDGDVVQASNTADLVFGPVALVRYVSEIFTLSPGDVIATGTPGGVGHARNPKRYLAEGTRLVTRIEGLGECRNTCRAEKR